MINFLKSKSIASYILAAVGILTLIIMIVYSTFTAPYAIFNGGALTCLIFVLLIDVGLFIFNTKFDIYFMLVAVVLATFALGIFIQDSVGTISDEINQVVFMGSGAPINVIYTLFVFMGIIIGGSIIACGFIKQKKLAS